MTYDFATDCRVVMIAKMKGGSGVSTTALMSSFSYANNHPDKKVGLVCADTTTYTISSFMSRARIQHPGVTPPVKTYQWKERFGLLADCVIEFAEQHQIDVLFIDMGPDGQLFKDSVELADLVIAPSQCTQADGERVYTVHDIATAKGIPVIVSLNRMSKAGLGQARIWRQNFEEEDLIVSSHEAIRHNEYAAIWGTKTEEPVLDRNGQPVLDHDGNPIKNKDVKVEYPTEFGAYKGLANEIAEVIS